MVLTTIVNGLDGISKEDMLACPTFAYAVIVDTPVWHYKYECLAKIKALEKNKIFLNE